MTFEKWQVLWYRAGIHENLFASLPADFPNLRNLKIQNQKLQRLLEGVYKIDDHWKILALKENIVRKNEGNRAARAGAQARKVQDMIAHSFNEWIRSGWKKLGHKFTNSDFRDWRKHWDDAMNKAIRQTKNNITERLIEKLKEPIALPPAKD